MNSVSKTQKVKPQNIEIKFMLSTVLKMGVDNSLYSFYVYMENYMHAYILLIMNMKEIFSYSASKEWGFFTVRLWSLGFKRLDIYL